MLNIIYDAVHIKCLARSRTRSATLPPFRPAALLCLLGGAPLLPAYLTDARLQIQGKRARILWNLFCFAFYIRCASQSFRCWLIVVAVISFFFPLLFVSNLHIGVAIVVAFRILLVTCAATQAGPAALSSALPMSVPLSLCCLFVPLSWQPLANLLPSRVLGCTRLGLPCEWSEREKECRLCICFAASALVTHSSSAISQRVSQPCLTHSLPSCPHCTRHDFIQSLFGNSKCKVKSTCLAASARTKCHFRFRQLLPRTKALPKKRRKKLKQQNCAQMKTLWQTTMLQYPVKRGNWVRHEGKLHSLNRKKL